MNVGKIDAVYRPSPLFGTLGVGIPGVGYFDERALGKTYEAQGSLRRTCRRVNRIDADFDRTATIEDHRNDERPAKSLDAVTVVLTGNIFRRGGGWNYLPRFPKDTIYLRWGLVGDFRRASLGCLLKKKRPPQNKKRIKPSPPRQPVPRATQPLGDDPMMPTRTTLQRCGEPHA